jgi:membrane associated rhomboid family serine protease
MKDPRFINGYKDFKFTGDVIQIEEWKQAFGTYLKANQKRPTYIFGLQSSDFQIRSWKKWFTYQFMHANFTHLLGNMAILLIFGAALELLIGGIPLIFVYLFSGFFGGFLFSLLSDYSSSPMVGASGSISGIMAFYALREWRKNISFLYFLSPAKNFFGLIYLPTWTLLFLSFLPDLNAYLTSSNEIGSSVAYTAHLGGAGFGFALGIIYLIIKKKYIGILESI